MKADRPDPNGAPIPPCSVIVATRNRPTLVLEAVRSILDGRCVPRELLVVDQSDEPNVELAALEHPECTIRIIQSTTVGVSASKNLGIRASSHAVVVLTDDDVLAEPQWLEALVGTLAASSERTVVTGCVTAGPPEIEGADAVSTTPEGKVEMHSGLLFHDPLAAGNCAFRRKVLDDVGLFDERLGAGARYPGADDNDLGFRLLKAGYSIRYVPEAVLVHRAWRAGADLRRLEWAYGRGQGAFFAKHMSLRDLHTLKRLKVAVDSKHPLRRKPSRSEATYLAGMLSGVAGWFVTERIGPRLRRWMQLGRQSP